MFGIAETQQLKLSPALRILNTLSQTPSVGSLDPQEEGEDENVPTQMTGNHETLPFSPCSLCKITCTAKKKIICAHG